MTLRYHLRMGQITDRITATPITQRPFPHFIADNILPPEVLTGMHQFWPTAPNFSKETPGNFTCDPRKLSEQTDASALQFWATFSQEIAPEIFRASLGQFAEWIVARYGPAARKFREAKFRLMQAEPSYGGIPAHTHHWHAPFWCATVLLYLDEVADGHQGTTLHGIKSALGDIEFASRIAAKGLHGMKDKGSTWEGADLTEAVTATYKANRMIAFLDSPISYHSVKPVTTVGHNSRRVFRMHFTIRQSELLYQVLYGVSEDEYAVRRQNGAEDPEVIHWLRRDIAQVWTPPPPLTLHARALWREALKITL